MIRKVRKRVSDEERINKKTFIIYTFLFFLMTSAIYGLFIIYNKSFIWSGDTFSQHYLIFKEYLIVLRDFFSNPLQGLQLWDWTIGMGSDVLTSYGYYAVGDPFVYLGLLFPKSMIEFAFHFTILLRVYFIGISFLLYSKKMKIKSSASLFGVFIYTFSTFSIMNVTRHPFFLMPMILFPLLCIGIEKILNNESNTLFITLVCISTLNNFYFFYMLTILIFLYAIIRYFIIYGKKKWKNISTYVWRAFYSYVIGVLLAGILFLPMIWGFLHSSREGVDLFASGLKTYNVNYYKDLMRDLLIPARSYWTVLGFPGIILLLIPFFWYKRKEFAIISTSMTIFFVMVLFPAFGSIMNGFSSPNNRWTFVLPFFVALGASIFYEGRFQLSRKELKAMGLSIFIYCLIIGNGISRTEFPYMYAIPIFFAIGTLLILSFSNINNKNKLLHRVYKKIVSVALFLMLMGNIVYNGLEYNFTWDSGSKGIGTIDEVLDYGTIEKKYTEFLGGAEKLIPKDKDFSRISVTSHDTQVTNQMSVLNQKGINSYLSITNENVANFSHSLELVGVQNSEPIRNGFDDRRIANNFLGVRYIITESKNKKYLPYGYKEIKQKNSDDNSFIIAETKNYFPFAHAETNYLTNESFEKLNPIEKEMYLSYGFVINEDSFQTDELQQFTDSIETQTIDYDIAPKNIENIEINKQNIKVIKDNEKVELTLRDSTEIEKSEVYLYLKGVDFYPNPEDTDFLTKNPNGFKIKGEMNGISKVVRQYDIFDFSLYIKRDNILLNLGYQDTKELPNKLNIQFDKKGIYNIDDIQIITVAVDEASYSKRIEKKHANKLNIEKISNEYISGTINQKEKSVLATSIPYTPGWKVKVNGEVGKTIKINKGFVGVPLNEGESYVEFYYKTPFLTLGIGVSVLGVILFLWNIFYERRGKKI